MSGYDGAASRAGGGFKKDQAHCMKFENSLLHGAHHPVDDARWRELFPLPSCAEVPHSAGLSVSQRRRRAKLRSFSQQTNSIIGVLNEMYAPSHKGDFSLLSCPSKAQLESQHAIFTEVAKQKTPNKVLSMREAVQELLQNDLSYSGEVATTVRSFDKDLLSIPESGHSAIDLSTVLDEVGREVIEDPHRCMLLSEDEWGSVIESEPPLHTYMDPILQHDLPKYVDFIKLLFDSGMIEFTDTPRSKVTPFCVAKKNGKLRLILDCRETNRMFKAPPPLALGTGASWSRISIPEGEKLFIAQSDIKDYFYSLQLPLPLRDLFCMPAIPTSLLRHWNVGAEKGGLCDNQGWVHPRLRVVPMGWSWAMWLSQRVHQYQSQLGANAGVDRVLVDGKACPDLRNGQVVLLPYADNLNVAGTDKRLVQEAKDGAVRRLREVGLIVHEELDACDVAQSLGFVIDGAIGRVSPVPDRLHRVQLALKWLSTRPKVSGKSIQRLVGHAVHFMMLRRELLSILRHLYDFIEYAGDRRCRLWTGAAREARWLSHLLTLCSADLRKQWSSVLTVSDASLSGIAVCSRDDVDNISPNIGSQRESWRYKGRNPASRPRHQTVERGDPFEDPDTVKPINFQHEDPFELNENFSEVPQECMADDKWKLNFAQHMSLSEPITILEGRGVVAALRHKFRSTHHFHCRHLRFGDNLGMVLAVDKGRSSSMGLLRICRRIACLLLATSSSLSCRWVPSEWNVADGGSRRWEHLRLGKTDARKEGHEKTKNHGREANTCSWDKSRLSSGKESKTCHSSDFAGFRQTKPSRQKNRIHEAGSSHREVQGSVIPGTECDFIGGSYGLSSQNAHLQTVRESGEAEYLGREQIRSCLQQISERAFLRRKRHRRSNKVFGSFNRQQARLFPQGEPPQVEEIVARMAQVGSRSNTTTNTLGSHRRSGAHHAEQPASTSRLCSPTDVRCIPEAWRGPAVEAAGLDSSNIGASASCLESASIGANGVFKDGSIRRESHFGFTCNTMDGPDTSNNSEACQQFSADVSHRLPPPSRCLGSFVGATGSRKRICSAISDQTLRSIIRSVAQKSKSSGGQKAWPMVERLFSKEIREPCFAESRVSEASQKDSSESQRCSVTSQQMGPKIFIPEKEKDLGVWVLEIFSGSGHLSKALVSRGFRVAAWDIDYNSGCDVLRREVTQNILSFLRQKSVVFVWFGMPCQSWSRARRWDGGPEPLRDDTKQLWGRHGLKHSDLKKVSLGNILLCWTIFMVHVLQLINIDWAVENPYTSRAWLVKEFQDLQSTHAVLHKVDYCQYGMPWKKSTGILSNLHAISSCLRCCNAVNDRCSASGKRHIILSGKDPTGTWWTLRAQPYPPRLCNALADCLARSLSASG